MEAVVCTDWKPLNQLWEQHNPTEKRWQHWLNRNLRNHLQRNVTAAYTANALRTNNWQTTVNLLGLTHQIGLTPRDAMLVATRGSTLSYCSLDMYGIDPKLRQHYEYGGILYSWSETSFSEHRQQLDHLYEAMVATQKRPDFSVITVEQAHKIAEDWVAELNRRAVESGGTTEVKWSWTARCTSPTIVTDENFDKPPTEKETTEQWEAHLLLDQPSYQAEGQDMAHCVATYWGKKCKIYSLRCDGIRKATIEVNEDNLSYSGGKLVCTQIRGQRNARPEQHVLDIAYRFLEHIGCSKPSAMTTGLLQGEIGRMHGVNIVANNNHHMQLSNLASGLAVGGAPMFEFIRDMQVSQDFNGRGPEITLTGVPTRAGMDALQQIWRTGR